MSMTAEVKLASLGTDSYTFICFVFFLEDEARSLLPGAGGGICDCKFCLVPLLLWVPGVPIDILPSSP